jgi:hypothetical protein
MARKGKCLGERFFFVERNAKWILMEQMKLFEVVFYGTPDAIFLARAEDFSEAVSLVEGSLSPDFVKEFGRVARLVYELGEDLSSERIAKVLRGPCRGSAYNFGWKRWDREIHGSDYTRNWIHDGARLDANGRPIDLNKDFEAVIAGAVEWLAGFEDFVVAQGRALTTEELEMARKAGVKRPECVRVYLWRAMPAGEGVVGDAQSDVGFCARAATTGYGIMVSAEATRDDLEREFSSVGRFEREGTLSSALRDRLRALSRSEG